MPPPRPGAVEPVSDPTSDREPWAVLLPAEIHPAGPESIADVARFTRADEYPDRAAMFDDLARFDAVVLRSFSLGAEEIERATRLKTVARHGAGLDSVDVAAATEHGVLVSNTPGANANAVAEGAIALALAVRRRLPAADAHVRAGGWDRAAFQSRELRGDTIGLLGLGAIGRRVAALADGLGMDVLAHDPYVDAAERATLVGFDALFDRADVVSVHVPLTEETRGAVDAAALARLPEGAILVNTARGEVLDQDALADALADGPLAGAGLDTFAAEPPDLDHPLFDRATVVCSPHVAGVTDEAKAAMSRRAAANVRTVYEGGVPESAVNPAVLDRD